MGLLEELKRRGVFRAAALYVAIAWGGTEILVFLVEALWGESAATPARKYLAVLFIAGFPVAMYLSWTRDLGLRARRLLGAGAMAVVLVALLSWLAPSERTPLPPKVTSHATIRSLAVLPLENLSDDPEQSFFAVGMTEALTAELSRLRDVRVISRSSVMQYSDGVKRLPEIAQELGVDAVVEGSVLRAGERVRITAQLIEAASEFHLWAGSVEGEMKEILALQNRAARSLAREMGASMNTTGQAEMTPRTVNPAAYDAYLKSLVHFMDSMNQPREAIASAQRVIELDPTFAPGYALLSELYGYLALTTPMNHGEAYVQSRRFAHLAMELDPWHPYSRFAMARVYYQFEWDWAAAEAEFQQGLELDPNNANGLAMYGAYQVVILKDCSSGIGTLESARDRDPFNAGLYFDLGVYNLHCRSYDTALAYFEQTLELRPGFYFARLFASWVHGMLGAHEQATSECRVLLSEHRATFDPYLLMLCGVVFAQSGNPDEAESMLAELEHPPGDFQVDPVVTAILYIALGEMDRGLDALEDGLEKRSPNLIFIRVAPAWDPVRENPRFTAILSRMKFPDD